MRSGKPLTRNAFQFDRHVKSRRKNYRLQLTKPREILKTTLNSETSLDVSTLRRQRI